MLKECCPILAECRAGLSKPIAAPTGEGESAEDPPSVFTQLERRMEMLGNGSQAIVDYVEHLDSTVFDTIRPLLRSGAEEAFAVMRDSFATNDDAVIGMIRQADQVKSRLELAFPFDNWVTEISNEHAALLQLCDGHEKTLRLSESAAGLTAVLRASPFDEAALDRASATVKEVIATAVMEGPCKHFQDEVSQASIRTCIEACTEDLETRLTTRMMEAINQVESLSKFLAAPVDGHIADTISTTPSGHMNLLFLARACIRCDNAAAAVENSSMENKEARSKVFDTARDRIAELEAKLHSMAGHDDMTLPLYGKATQSLQRLNDAYQQRLNQLGGLLSSNIDLAENALGLVSRGDKDKGASDWLAGTAVDEWTNWGELSDHYGKTLKKASQADLKLAIKNAEDAIDILTAENKTYELELDKPLGPLRSQLEFAYATKMQGIMMKAMREAKASGPNGPSQTRQTCIAAKDAWTRSMNDDKSDYLSKLPMALRTKVSELIDMGIKARPVKMK